jgi:hypothetical protein
MKTEREKYEKIMDDCPFYERLTVDTELWSKFRNYLFTVSVDELIFLNNLVLGTTILDNNYHFLQNYIKNDVNDYCYRVDNKLYNHNDRYVFVKPKTNSSDRFTVVCSFTGDDNVHFLIDRNHLAKIMAFSYDVYGKYLKL